MIFSQKWCNLTGNFLYPIRNNRKSKRLLHPELSLPYFVLFSAVAYVDFINLIQLNDLIVQVTQYDDWRRHQFLTDQRPRNYLTHKLTHNQLTVRPCSTSSNCKKFHINVYLKLYLNGHWNVHLLYVMNTCTYNQRISQPNSVKAKVTTSPNGWMGDG